jgi:hypothetical protein
MILGRRGSRNQYFNAYRLKTHFGRPARRQCDSSVLELLVLLFDLLPVHSAHSLHVQMLPLHVLRFLSTMSDEGNAQQAGGVAGSRALKSHHFAQLARHHEGATLLFME